MRNGASRWFLDETGLGFNFKKFKYDSTWKGEAKES
jgi:hypothetical protein